MKCPYFSINLSLNKQFLASSENFVLVNLCNANTEKDQLNTTIELSEMLKSANKISTKRIIPGGDFNPLFKKIYCQND